MTRKAISLSRFLRTKTAASGVPFNLPFYYGWAIVACAFATMAVGVNARTAFSLLYPAILAEFNWARGETAGAFALGFIFAAAMGPFTGALLTRFGPRVVMPLGSVMMAAGITSTTWISEPWMLYPSFGMLVVGGSTILGYIGHSATLPLWFQKRRGLAVGIAFAGVGVGAMVVLPLTSWIIQGSGWRDACWSIAAIIVFLLIPLNLIVQRRSPEDLGLLPDGAKREAVEQGEKPKLPSSGPTLRDALKMRTFWFFAASTFGMLWCWYAVQVHQTQYLLDQGFDPAIATLALSLVSVFGVIGQINGGWMSDKLGREGAWTIGLLGFAGCYAALFLMSSNTSSFILWGMVIMQGLVGYGVTAIFASAPADVFQGKSFSTIFGTLSIFSSLGGGIGPYVTGVIYDLDGNYSRAFLICIGWCVVSIIAMWLAAPRRYRRR
ncbi:MAG: MFS transporter [Alphaproteobacteria bacterium]|jgi:MFS family permease